MDETESGVRQVGWVLDQVAQCLSDLDETQLSWGTPTGECNDARTIATHVLGATTTYVLGLVLGRPVGRDRFAEFHPTNLDPAVPIAEQLAMREAVMSASRDLVELDVAVIVPTDWVGPAVVGTRRDALLEALHHASIHLGELRLVRDLALRA